MASEELQVACRGLARAERSFRKSPDSYQTRDLAYVAERQSRMAEVASSINIERGRQFAATLDCRKANGEVRANTKAPPNTAAEHPETEALIALKQLVEVKQEPRGLVIVLSGSSLFASGESVLLPEARILLDSVHNLLLDTRERDITIEGHTDSQGLDSDNIEFSKRRANAVRDYLVQRDYRADHVPVQWPWSGASDRRQCNRRGACRKPSCRNHRRARISNAQ